MYLRKGKDKSGHTGKYLTQTKLSYNNYVSINSKHV
jgi:hypothetical protein